MTAELLLIALVALVVFGPKKLPMLARHLGTALRTLNQFKLQINRWWQHQLKQLQLQENLRKAKEAEDAQLEQSKRSD